MPSVEAVLFDYGLVLSGPPDAGAWHALKQVVQADQLPFHDAYWKFRHDYDRGTLNGSAYWKAVAADLDQNLSRRATRRAARSRCEALDAAECADDRVGRADCSEQES